MHHHHHHHTSHDVHTSHPFQATVEYSSHFHIKVRRIVCDVHTHPKRHAGTRRTMVHGMRMHAHMFSPRPFVHIHTRNDAAHTNVSFSAALSFRSIQLSFRIHFGNDGCRHDFITHIYNNPPIQRGQHKQRQPRRNFNTSFRFCRRRPIANTPCHRFRAWRAKRQRHIRGRESFWRRFACDVRRTCARNGAEPTYCVCKIKDNMFVAQPCVRIPTERVDDVGLVC